MYKRQPHGIQGIGANFIPATLDLDVLDGALAVSADDALAAARDLASREGLLVGISSGANAAAVRKLAAERPEARGATVVTFAVDTGERLSLIHISRRRSYVGTWRNWHTQRT